MNVRDCKSLIREPWWADKSDSILQANPPSRLKLDPLALYSSRLRNNWKRKIITMQRFEAHWWIEAWLWPPTARAQGAMKRSGTALCFLPGALGTGNSSSLKIKFSDGWETYRQEGQYPQAVRVQGPQKESWSVATAHLQAYRKRWNGTQADTVEVQTDVFSKMAKSSQKNNGSHFPTVLWESPGMKSPSLS